jgi:hypothetical protein
MFRDQCVHRSRLNANSTAGHDREILQIGHSLWANGMITAEVTERMPLPPACSVTWPAGQFSTRRPFILGTHAI